MVAIVVDTSKKVVDADLSTTLFQALINILCGR